MQKTHLSRFVLLALLLASVQVAAQDNISPTADGPVIPADEFDRGTPHRSAEGIHSRGGRGQL